MTENNEGLEQLIDDTFPHACYFLRQDCPTVNKKAFAIMEWWRQNTSVSSGDIRTPRFRVLWSWGRLVALISLCVPSSVAVERVFPLLKLFKAKIKGRMLHDELESSMIMRVNDVNVQ